MRSVGGKREVVFGRGSDAVRGVSARAVEEGNLQTDSIGLICRIMVKVRQTNEVLDE